VPLSFIFALVLLGIGLLVAVGVTATYKPVAPTEEDQTYRRRNGRPPLPTPMSRNAAITVVFAAFGIVGGILIFSASFTSIAARSVGVETSFGRPTAHALDNGPHFILPWHKVEKFDASIQTLVMTGDGSSQEADAPCVTVRLGNQTTACVDVIRAQWNIDPDGDVIDLYRRYKKFDKVELNVVAGQAMNALVTRFADYDPLAGINAKGDKPAVTTTQLAEQARKDLQAAVGTGIKIDNLLILVHYDPTTQTKLNNYAQALADTRIAVQNTATATQVALANKALAGQESVNNPGVQYQNCLSLIRELAARGQLRDLPQTFNCGDPRSQVIVQANKN
jgi:regulator of protease activity HflC (stomatin/prohibitin superfamily)